MIKREFFGTRADGVRLYKTFSDKGLPIRKIENGEEYDEAIDTESSAFEYEEISPEP